MQQRARPGDYIAAHTAQCRMRYTHACVKIEQSIPSLDSVLSGKFHIVMAGACVAIGRHCHSWPAIIQRQPCLYIHRSAEVVPDPRGGILDPYIRPLVILNLTSSVICGCESIRVRDRGNHAGTICASFLAFIPREGRPNGRVVSFVIPTPQVSLTRSWLSWSHSNACVLPPCVGRPIIEPTTVQCDRGEWCGAIWKIAGVVQ